MPRRLVTSDSHGGYKALIQCLEKCKFNMEEDTLFFLGDCTDGWSQTKESIELLMSIPNLVRLVGNHDQWSYEYYLGQMDKTSNEYVSWLHHGGNQTRVSYDFEPMPKEHIDFLVNAKPYHITEDNILMVHAGFIPTQPIEQTSLDDLIWNRNFARECYKRYIENYIFEVKPYKEIYIGHTPTIFLAPEHTLPLRMGNVWDIDTGAGFNGRLSIMDIDSKKIWQSDKLRYLYPKEKGRNNISWAEERIRMGI